MDNWWSNPSLKINLYLLIQLAVVLLTVQPEAALAAEQCRVYAVVTQPLVAQYGQVKKTVKRGLKEISVPSSKEQLSKDLGRAVGRFKV